MASWVPADWTDAGGRVVLAVPVQTIETWLLVLRDPAFGGRNPEKTYYRPALKNELYGPTRAPAARSEIAFELLSRADARAVLLTRPSYRQFADEVATWRT